MKKISALSWLLALLLTLAPLAALAENGQCSYDVSFAWHNPKSMDEDENALLASLCKAVAFSGSCGADGDALYHNFDLLVGGATALRFDTYLAAEGVYVNSPLLNGAVGIRLDAMMDQIMLEAESDPEIGAILSAFSGVAAMFEKLGEQGPEMFFETLQMEALVEEVTGLILDKVLAVVGSPQPYAGIIHSTLGVETAFANVYTITGTDLMELFRGVVLAMADHTEYWDSIVTMLNYDTLLQEMDISREEFIAEIVGMLRDTAASFEADDDGDVELQVYECLDSGGKTVLYQIKLNIASPYSYYETFANILEWVPGKTGFYTHIGDSSSSVELKLTPADNGWLAFMQIHDYWDTTTLMLKTACDENGSSLELAQLEDGMVDWGLTVDTVCADGRAEITFGRLEAAAREPLLTIAADYSDEPAPPRFTPDTYEGIIQYPLDMEPDELESFGEKLQIGAMQALLRTLSMLPPDVFGVFMNEFGFLF